MASAEVGQNYQANIAMPAIEDYYSPVLAIKKELDNTSALTAEEKIKVVPCGYGHMADGDIQMSFSIGGKGDEEGKALFDKVSTLSD